MRGLRNLLALCLLMPLPLLVLADPINDGVFAGYKAGWFANIHAGKPVTCPQVCKRKLGVAAEYEAAPGPLLKRTFVCKVAYRPEGQVQTFLYGNQFDARPACYTTYITLKGTYSEKFLCLCVSPLR